MSILSAPFPSITPPSHRHHHHHHARSLPVISITIISIALSITVFLSLLFLLLYLLHRRKNHHNHLSQNPNPTPDSTIPASIQRLSSSLLRRATSSFSAFNKLGHGGFGPVYRGLLPPSLERTEPRPVAIKLMDSTSLQGDREFLNELSLSSHIPSSPTVLLPFAFSLSSPNPNNGFFHSPFHFSCFNTRDGNGNGNGNTSPPSDRNCMMLVYDLMPNGSLQDALLGRKSPEIVNSWPRRFSVAIDVARALFFLHETCDPPVIHGDVKPSNVLLDSDFSAKLADFGLARMRSNIEKEDQEEEEGDANDELNDVASELGTATNGDADVDESNAAMSPVAEPKTNGGDASNKDWWWRQDDTKSTNSKNDATVSGTAPNGSDDPNPSVKKDYVMEWIRSEIKKERPKREWWAQSANKPSSNPSSTNKELEKTSHRPSREWWREEFTEELSNKHKSRSNSWFLREREKRTNCSDQVVPKSGATVSSTPSMRGTVCYVAPEYGGGGPVSERCDIYSYGVLLLVIVSGRRPLQVAPLASPASEFERASLVSWARHLAHQGRLVELVDPELRENVGELDRDQVILCVTVALLCIQRVPVKRPSAGEVVRILTGEAEAPHLPVEYSPSPPGGRFSFKRRKKNGG